MANFQAVCDQKDLNAPKRSKRRDAEADALAHDISGHVVKVITTQGGASVKKPLASKRIKKAAKNKGAKKAAKKRR